VLLQQGKVGTFCGLQGKQILQKIGWGGVDWNGLLHNRNQWRALVNAAMNLREVLEWLHNCWPLEKDTDSMIVINSVA
jgi:hypothetical protein